MLETSRIWYQYSGLYDSQTEVPRLLPLLFFDDDDCKEIGTTIQQWGKRTRALFYLGTIRLKVDNTLGIILHSLKLVYNGVPALNRWC